MILFGGRSSTTLNLNDVWVLNNANGTGGEPDRSNVTPSGNSPQARSDHSAVYDATNDHMIIFGSCSGYSLPLLNDVWMLTKNLQVAPRLDQGAAATAHFSCRRQLLARCRLNHWAQIRTRARSSSFAESATV